MSCSATLRYCSSRGVRPSPKKDLIWPRELKEKQDQTWMGACWACSFCAVAEMSTGTPTAFFCTPVILILT
eukprot:3767098-Rhodomonas_salina.1